VVSMRNETSDNIAQIYFATNSSPNLEESKSVFASIVPNDAGQRYYFFDMAQNPNWTGTVKQIRFDPANSASTGSVRVEFIKFVGAYSGKPPIVPSVVEAENFNVGGEGNAYHDNDAANNGFEYRPDEGVDLQSTSDNGGGYNIGWTNNGEWTEYLINVPNTGTYTATLRYASTGSINQYRLDVNGQDVTGTITVPTTGGLQTFLPSRNNVTLQQGLNLVRLNIVASDGSFNVNRLNFLIATTTGLDDSKSLEEGFNVFPNPASSILYIQVPASSIGKELELIDLYGTQLIKAIATNINTISVTNLPKGTYMVKIEGLVRKIIIGN
jgi:Carbohydrate binding module (family 6)/Secretion system C-terminal sorting domain